MTEDDVPCGRSRWFAADWQHAFDLIDRRPDLIGLPYVAPTLAEAAIWAA